MKMAFNPKIWLTVILRSQEARTIAKGTEVAAMASASAAKPQTEIANF